MTGAKGSKPFAATCVKRAPAYENEEDVCENKKDCIERATRIIILSKIKPKPEEIWKENLRTS
jgi:hypothetical protein